jgi:alkylation response protein AidB-like acyl-CoA dehydrogenase
VNFDWTIEEKRLKQRISALLDRDAILELDELDRAEIPKIRNTTKRYLEKLGQSGYLKVGVGPESRSDTLTLIAGQDEISTASGALFLSVEVTARVFGGLLKAFGASEPIEEITERLERGLLIGAVAVSESEDNKSSEYMPTSIHADGDFYVLSGRKDFVTNAPIADFIAVVAKAPVGQMIAVVDPASPGVAIGERLKTLGYDGLTVAGVNFKNVRVPKALTLGPFTDSKPLDFLSQIQDLVLTMTSVGLMKSTLASAKKYSDTHIRGGRPVNRFQEIRFKLADMVTLSQTAELLAYRAGWLYSLADSEASTVLHCAKVFSSEAAEQVTSMAMQIMAGPGYVSGNPVERAYREAKYAAIAGTTSEVARMAIADDLLQMYKV